MNEYIKILLREHLLGESAQSEHLFNRLKGRIDMLSDEEITSRSKSHLTRYLDILLKLDFNPRQSFAVKVLDLDINPDSKLYVNVNGREYYRLNDFMGRDSTGDQIWVIVRNNRAITIMLRKHIQPEYKLGVDLVVKNIDDLQQLIRKNIVK
tara:strand:+ start:106889 stop:107344 length:456 start_codon:yes stop_codon:yes gene_type:complete